MKFVIAPHNIKPEHIQSLKKSISKKTVLYSEIAKNDLSQFDVLIVDTIGLLTKIYSYADMAYVGGAFGTGLHNTLEPAVFGIPIIIGPDFNGFNEAKALVSQKGIIPINNKDAFLETMSNLMDNPEHASNTGKINFDFVHKNKGASIQIMEHIRRLL